MPRTVPSQIVAYLRQVFPNRADLNVAVLEQQSGGLVGLLELLDALPAELIRVNAKDYAEFVSNVATIRLRVDQFRTTRSTDALRFISPALPRVWDILEKMPDAPTANPSELQFIADATLRDLIAQDLTAINTNLQSGEWKGATVLAGSCAEALLLYGLQEFERRKPGSISAALGAITWKGKAPNATDLTDRSWDLFSYTEVAYNLSLLASNTRTELHTVRDYRNLIHPAKSIRQNARCDRGTALVGAGAVEHVVNDIRARL